ncbi:hypothetical protein MRB53_023195 [Persea americana]|uniref:Uncharacterized protein n=1 Tax=Persea americana TaxID=3435 RepID=A0ACC2L940_PERAE|nr:hypothetical protein MRB53_023195 [Persea americana]
MDLTPQIQAMVDERMQQLFLASSTGSAFQMATTPSSSGSAMTISSPSGLVVSVVNRQPGETIIDCCAAPGGKTLFMASYLRGQGMVFAIDLNKGRLRIFEETAKLQNVDDIVTAVHADLRNFSVSYWTANRGKHLELLLE